jgi:23S rRNA pseudouridine1911/1915/1917 synthase
MTTTTSKSSPDWEASEPIEWTVGTELAGQRIDKFITDALEEDTSRTQIQQWIKDGHVTVNGKPAKTNYKLSVNDSIVVTIPEPVDVELTPQDIPLDVIFEDSDVIVVNKPRGLVVHPAPGHYSGTLVNALLYHCKDLSGINGVLRPGIVHRIDKDTSGLIMAAKNDKAHASLADQLKAHTVNRKYIALVHGNIQHENGTIEAPIGRDSHDRKMYTVTEKNSKHAVTHFLVLERFGDFTLVELMLETGRTHQIRVHMKFIGHPLVGDPMYGKSKGTMDMEGQALHAAVLGFKHPRSEEQLLFEAPLPTDFEDLLFRIRNR